MEIKISFIHRILLAILFIACHFGCNEQELLYNSDLLLGEWQLYSTISSDGNDLSEGYENDPVLRINFYGVDSVKYFTLFGTYTSKEELGEILFHVTVNDMDTTYRHEVMKLDSSELWLKEITYPDGPREMRFKKK